MAKKRGASTREDRAGIRKKNTPPVSGKEINYVLQITEDDARLLSRYRTLLVQGAAGYAETAYNYLFDNPDIADALYAYERSGGSIGEFVRGQLEHMLDLLDGDITEAAALKSETLGRGLHDSGIKPLWTLGSYRIFLDHLLRLAGTDPNIAAGDRAALQAALIKTVFRDAGITSESYWRSAVEKLVEQRDELNFEQDLAEELLNGIPQLLWTVNVEANCISYVSPGARKFWGENPDTPIPCFSRIDGAERERVLMAWQQAIDGQSVQREVRVDAPDGGPLWYRMAFYPTRNRRGRVLRVHCLMEDVTESRADRQRLEQLSTTDEVTGLANRALWYDRLGSALAVARRTPAVSVAVMTLDVNRFTMYNDLLGQQLGNELLRQVGARLRTLVRDSDTLAHLGGDEFGIILPLLRSPEKDAERVARKVIQALSEPFRLGENELCVSIATGIALFPQHGEDPDSLASHADSAMYRAKSNAMPFSFYESTASVSAAQHLQFSGQLHGALERDEFELYYQPKLATKTGELTGAEALIRWKHPQQGMVLPRQFIPVAEQLGMITPITDWVLTSALRASNGWSVNGKPVAISINVSAQSFRSPGLSDNIRSALAETGVEGSRLEIEVTEGTLMSDLERGAEVLSRLKALGVSIAIDNFGTGYSSLATLRHLPISTLKIDQSFLDTLNTDPQDEAIVRSIIELGHNLGCTVVAEGVEDAAVLSRLVQLGCDQVQGYHIARPLSQEGFLHWLSQSRH